MAEHRERFLVTQKTTLAVNRYRVVAPDGDGGEGELLAFAEQKRLQLKEEVVFFADEEKSTRLFSFKARKRLDVHGALDVLDEAGAEIGSFSKVFRRSLWRSTWRLQVPGLDATGQERRPVVAVLRRLWGAVPFLENFPAPFLFHFDFVDDATGEPVLTSQKRAGLRDRYSVDVLDRRLDFRVAAGMAVALDALQSR